MHHSYNEDFWGAIDDLVRSGNIIIDRPRNSSHPRFPNIIYPVDYGYIDSTKSMDGGGIDIWRGTLEDSTVRAIICTVDLKKRDSEIKLLIGCTEDEICSVYNFHNNTEYMKGLLIYRQEIEV